MSEQQDIWDEVSRFDRDFRPDQGRRPGPEILPAGQSYDFLILGTAAGRAQDANASPILRLSLRVQGGAYDGQELELTWWMTRQEAMDRIGGDLQTLGLAVTKDRPFSEQLPALLPRLASIRFRGFRSDGGSATGKVYHNLYVNARLAASSPPPPSALTPPSRVVLSAPPVGMLPADDDNEEEIPF